MTGYSLEYQLGPREYAMQMTDGSGAVVMASRGTLEKVDGQLLLTETSRFFASGDAHAGTWKSTSDNFQVEWSIDPQGRLLWKPLGTTQSIVMDRKKT